MSVLRRRERERNRGREQVRAREKTGHDVGVLIRAEGGRDVLRGDGEDGTQLLRPSVQRKKKREKEKRKGKFG